LPRLKPVSGFECLKILCNKFGFGVARQSGDHVVLKKETPQGRIGTVIPLHRELKRRTLRRALQLAKVTEEEFAKYL